RVAGEHPRVGERRHLGLVDAALLAFAHRADREATGPIGCGLTRFEGDLHPERVARTPVARALVQIDQRRVLSRGVTPERLVWLLGSCAFLNCLEECWE